MSFHGLSLTYGEMLRLDCSCEMVETRQLTSSKSLRLFILM